MTALANKMTEKKCIRRIRVLVDERHIAISTIAMKSGVEIGTIKALYEDKPNKKVSVSDTTARKVNDGLDACEASLGMMKRCNRCGKTQPYGHFYPHPNTADGYENICAGCKALSEKERKQKKKEAKVNNCKDKPVTAEIVKRVKAEDKRDVESKFMAPYFGIAPKQLDDIRAGKWDSLMYTPKEPKKADSVLASVEELRTEIAALRREVEKVLTELGVDYEVR